MINWISSQQGTNETGAELFSFSRIELMHSGRIGLMLSDHLLVNVMHTKSKQSAIAVSLVIKGSHPSRLHFHYIGRSTGGCARDRIPGWELKSNPRKLWRGYLLLLKNFIRTKTLFDRIR